MTTPDPLGFGHLGTDTTAWTTELDAALPDPPPSEDPQEQAEVRFANWVENRISQRLETALLPLRVENAQLKTRVEQLEALARRSPAATGSATTFRPPSFKVNVPAVFNGTRETGEAFLNSCHLYLQLQRDAFPSADDKVGWILSYMTDGRARTWRDNAIAHHSQHGRYEWADEQAFYAAFRSEFFPVAESEAALIRLESHLYYQKQSEPVDTYVDRFRDLVKKAKLGEGAHVVIKFRRGLLHSLHSALLNAF